MTSSPRPPAAAHRGFNRRHGGTVPWYAGHGAHGAGVCVSTFFNAAVFVWDLKTSWGLRDRKQPCTWAWPGSPIASRGGWVWRHTCTSSRRARTRRAHTCAPRPQMHVKPALDSEAGLGWGDALLGATNRFQGQAHLQHA